MIIFIFLLYHFVFVFYFTFVNGWCQLFRLKNAFVVEWN